MNAREEYENFSESTENRSISGEVRVVPNREDIRHSVLVSSLEASRGHRQRWSQIHSSRRRSRYGELYHVPDVHRTWSRHDIGMCQQTGGIWTLGGTQTPRAGRATYKTTPTATGRTGRSMTGPTAFFLWVKRHSGADAQQKQEQQQQPLGFHRPVMSRMGSS